MYPKKIDKVIVPPIKCQGIKTKLINFISSNIIWDNKGVWYEPFLGSGVVLFNIKPTRAVVSDKNKHIINFYKSIQSGQLTPQLVREYLEYQGDLLQKRGEEYYYEVRKRFNETFDSLDFLFLTRACFNGVMRFNKNGGFNVPFCKKNDRFQKAYITKITNQVANICEIMKEKEWHFISCDWRETLEKAQSNDFVYLDPPYIGRDTGYFGEWDEKEARELSIMAHKSPAKIALSMWKENKYRVNEHIRESWVDFRINEFDHFYYVGSTESLRNKMTEALLTNY